MGNWGPTTYGDRCRECGFDWSTGQTEAVGLVAETPDRYAALLVGRSGTEQHRDLGWPVVGYVCHVGDNLRIWAERLAGHSMGDTGPVAPYDESLLGTARNYQGAGPHGALWSLGRAVDDWLEAVELAAGRGVVLVHPERGPEALVDVVRANAHDAHHHGWDIERSLAAS